MICDDCGGNLRSERDRDFFGHSGSQRKRNRPNFVVLAKRDRIGEAAFEDFDSETVIKGVGTTCNNSVTTRKAWQLLQQCLSRAKLAFR
ncbi:unnamed protein product [Ciceribacter sp. T2.26MG-112.2]|nr:unnamed protein product [Ciceribacter naphthalenivorans]